MRGYAREAIAALQVFAGETAEETIAAPLLAEELERALSILHKGRSQTERRVMGGETGPTAEKIVSFFECHTDIIVKGGRETQYGHKVFLTGGSSGLIRDCLIEWGNPADASPLLALIARHEQIFPRPPRQLAADGGFASQDNLKVAKGKGVKDVMFVKKRGLAVLEMVQSLWVYKKLRNFRAGIEAQISRRKRTFGLDRCNWTG